MSETPDVTKEGGSRRIDLVLEPSFVEGLPDLDMDGLRERRDLCRGERDYLSFVRRLIQGRRDILRAEKERRATGGQPGSVADQLATILADAPRGPSRGEAMFVAMPDEEIARARRRVEKILGDTALSNVEALSDEDLDAGIAKMEQEETLISDTRSKVLAVHDALQDDLKRRYREQLGTDS